MPQQARFNIQDREAIVLLKLSKISRLHDRSMEQCEDAFLWSLVFVDTAD